MSTDPRTQALNTPIGGHVDVGSGPDARRVNRGGEKAEAFADRVEAIAKGMRQ